VSVDSISNSVKALDQQQLLQTRASGGVPAADALSASPGFTAIQYVEPPPARAAARQCARYLHYH
jgi:hypothetical protein